MPAPTIDKLHAYLPSKILSADGDALAEHTLQAGSTSALLVSATLNQATAYWNGASGFFSGNTTTAALRGVFFHVESSVPNNLTLATNLAAEPVAGDTISVWLGGGTRSSSEAFGLLVDDSAPELFSILGSNLPGVTVTKASPTLGVGTLEIAYDSVAGTLAARMGAGAYGTAVDCTGTLTDVPLFIDADAGFVCIDSDPLLLPVGNASDTFVLTQPKGTFTPNYEGYETLLGAGGKVRYRLEVVRNEDPLTDMVDVSVYSDKPAGSATTIAAGESLGLTAADVEVTDATGWPLTGFWLKNTTKNDCRYIFARTGNVLSAASANGWVKVAYFGGRTGLAHGVNVFRYGGVAYGTVVDFTIASGTLAGNNAAGDMLINFPTGNWASGGSNIVYFDGGPYGGQWAFSITSAVYGLRNHTAVAWAEGDAVELMSDVDLMADVPGVIPAPTFESPAGETYAPGSMAFTHAATLGTALALATLRPGEAAGVWRREWIMDDARARAGMGSDTSYSWS